jgi:hypothetical protein
MSRASNGTGVGWGDGTNYLYRHSSAETVKWKDAAAITGNDHVEFTMGHIVSGAGAGAGGGLQNGGGTDAW